MYQKYRTVQRAMKPINEWITYRTRFLVKAKQLQYSLTFTDSLGRQHAGRKGDYLVESSDGILRIAPRKIFEDVYVSMSETPLGGAALQALHYHAVHEFGFSREARDDARSTVGERRFSAANKRRAGALAPAVLASRWKENQPGNSSLKDD